MRRSFCTFASARPAARAPLACVAIGLLASVAAADLTVALHTDADITNLYLQQPFTVEVQLSGMAPGQELVFLGVTVNTDGYRMGTPVAINRGAIVPAPGASPTDFLVAAAPGIADASFYTDSTAAANHIRSDGVFFTFDFVPTRAGSVTFEVTFTDALLFNPLDVDAPLPISISASGTLDVVVFCPADYNEDGGIDGADVQDFFAAWESAEPRSDVNGDGGIDGQDVITFFDAWENASC